MTKSTLSQDIEKLKLVSKKTNITIADTQLVSSVIANYFNAHNRSRNFLECRDEIAPRFKELLEHCNMLQGVEFTEQFYLFIYTLSENYEISQLEIYKYIATPFKAWVLAKWDGIKQAFHLSTKNQTKTITIIARHCMTEGMYAPGKSIYSYAEALLKSGEKVDILCVGNLDQQFIKLEEKYPNLRVSRLIGSDFNSKLVSILEILRITRPKLILCEMEFGFGGILGILVKNIPTIYLSQGFYNLPYYDKIVVSDILKEQNVSARKDDLIYYPSFLSAELLAPKPDKQKIYSIKSELGISNTDFIISSFGRMEKFSKEFLEDCKFILQENCKVKLILAGSNDQSLCKEMLHQFIQQKRAFILPPSDTISLGYITTIGIDSHPNPGGYAVLELMAKGKPVLCKDGPSLNSWRKQRQKEMLYDNRNDLLNLVEKLTNDKNFFKKSSSNAKEFSETLGIEKGKAFVNSLGL